MSLCVDGLPFLYETLARFMSLLCPLTCSTSLFCWSYQAFEPGLIDIALLVFALDRVFGHGGLGCCSMFLLFGRLFHAHLRLRNIYLGCVILTRSCSRTIGIR